LPAVAGGSSRRLAHFAHGGASRSRPSPSPNCSRACGGSLMAGARIHRRDGFGSALGAVARYCPSTTWPLTIVLTCSWPVSQQGHRSAPISTADAQITVICLVHGAACATRSVKDFAHTGVELVEPWCASGWSVRWSVWSVADRGGILCVHLGCREQIVPFYEPCG